MALLGSSLSLFGSCDVLSWWTLPPSLRAPVSGTINNLMEMVLENLHGEICACLLQLPSVTRGSKIGNSGETRSWELTSF